MASSLSSFLSMASSLSSFLSMASNLSIISLLSLLLRMNTTTKTKKDIKDPNKMPNTGSYPGGTACHIMPSKTELTKANADAIDMPNLLPMFHSLMQQLKGTCLPLIIAMAVAACTTQSALARAYRYIAVSQGK